MSGSPYCIPGILLRACARFNITARKMGAPFNIAIHQTFFWKTFKMHFSCEHRKMSLILQSRVLRGVAIPLVLATEVRGSIRRLYEDGQSLVMLCAETLYPALRGTPSNSCGTQRTCICVVLIPGTAIKRGRGTVPSKSY